MRRKEFFKTGRGPSQKSGQPADLDDAEIGPVVVQFARSGYLPQSDRGCFTQGFSLSARKSLGKQPGRALRLPGMSLAPEQRFLPRPDRTFPRRRNRPDNRKQGEVTSPM